MPTAATRLKGVQEIIEKSGICPAAWEITQFTKGVQLLEEYQEYVDKGQVHPDFEGAGRQLKLREFRELLADMRGELMKQASTWREYRIPKMRAVEAEISGKDGGSISFIVKK